MVLRDALERRITEEALLERNARLAVRLREVQHRFHWAEHDKRVKWAQCTKQECEETRRVLDSMERTPQKGR